MSCCHFTVFPLGIFPFFGGFKFEPISGCPLGVSVLIGCWAGVRVWGRDIHGDHIVAVTPEPVGRDEKLQWSKEEIREPRKDSTDSDFVMTPRFACDT